MDTRRKILNTGQALEEARALHSAGTPVFLISGYFDVLQPVMIRQLLAAISDDPEARVFARVLPPPAPLLNAQARVELAAALQVIDYVIDSEFEPADFIASMAPDRHIRAEKDHLATRERLVQHVLERHGRRAH